MDMDKYFYKKLKFNAAVFKRNREIFLAAKDEKFYTNLVLALKTIPNNPKKYKTYSTLTPPKGLKRVMVRKITPFNSICFVYKHLKNYQDDNTGSIIENGKEIILEYTDNFIYELEEGINSLGWDSSHGEVGLSGIILCPKSEWI